MPGVKLFAIFVLTSLLAAGADLRLGIIGTDTSHVIAFTRILNDASLPDHVDGARVVAAFKGGSKDVKESATRVDKFAEELKTKWKVEFTPDIASLCRKVDAVLLESVDGRTHLEQAKIVIAAGKPMQNAFIESRRPHTSLDGLTSTEFVARPNQGHNHNGLSL